MMMIAEKGPCMCAGGCTDPPSLFFLRLFISCRASYGTTKYCNSFLRYLPCNNPECLFLHEVGNEDDSFTKEEIQVSHRCHLSPLGRYEHGIYVVLTDIRISCMSLVDKRLPRRARAWCSDSNRSWRTKWNG